MRERLGVEEPGVFWEQVRTNLHAGKIRLVFVADDIPPELHRIVEFLNEQMDPAEVLAVEVKQFVGPDLKALVPRLLGQAARKSVPRDSRQWDSGAFFDTLQGRHPECVAPAKAIFDWAKANGLRIDWGSGTQTGSMTPRLVHGGFEHVVIGVYTSGSVEHRFQSMRPPFDTAERRREIVDRFAAIPGFSFPDDAESRWPTIRLATLADEAALKQFLEVLDWFVAEVRRS